MATDRQNEANRQNAQQSTGPRTAEGKARSCLNHLQTGIDATSAVIPGEDSADHEALTGRYYDQFLPATEDERHQVDILIRCDWQSRRYVRGEAQLWNRAMSRTIQRNEPNPMAEAYVGSQITFSRLDRRADSNERAYNRARRELERLQSLRPATEAPAQPVETEAPSPELGSNRQTVSPSPIPPENRKPVASQGAHHPVDTPKSA